MVLFRKKNTADMDVTINESFANLLSVSFSTEYRETKQVIQEMEEDGLSAELDSLKSNHRLSFQAIQDFLLSTLSQIDSRVLLGEHLRLSPENVGRVLLQPELDQDYRVEAFASEIAESCSYYAESVGTGNLLTMPGANLEQSQSYRSYLLGNILNGELNWGWGESEMSRLQKTDSHFTQIMGRFLTENFDLLNSTISNKRTISDIHNKACRFVVKLCLIWELSSPRAKVGLIQ